jgi:hypothetical protein
MVVKSRRAFRRCYPTPDNDRSSTLFQPRAPLMSLAGCDGFRGAHSRSGSEWHESGAERSQGGSERHTRIRSGSAWHKSGAERSQGGSERHTRIRSGSEWHESGAERSRGGSERHTRIRSGSAWHKSGADSSRSGSEWHESGAVTPGAGVSGTDFAASCRAMGVARSVRMSRRYCRSRTSSGRPSEAK